jgi:hypothetical protein
MGWRYPLNNIRERIPTLPILPWFYHEATWILAALIEMNAPVVASFTTHSSQNILCFQVELEPRSGERKRSSSILAGKAQR